MAILKQRALPPSQFTDEAFLELPALVRMTATGLRMYADDRGRASAHPGLIARELYPLDPEPTASQIEEHLLELAVVGFLDLYEAGGRTYFSIIEWPAVDRAKPSKIPPPPPRDPRPMPSRAHREDVAVEGGEGEGESEWESDRGRDRERAEGESAGRPARPPLDGLPPSSFCDKHRDQGGSDYPCQRCGNARLYAKEWTALQIARERGTVPRFEETEG
jgi:hypothetical protein